MSKWIVATVGDVTSYQRAGGTPSATNASFYGGEIPFVIIEDMTRTRKFLAKTEKTLSEKGLRNSAAWLIREPHVLYSMYATVGKPVINVIECATNQAIIALRVNDCICQPFLYYSLEFIRPFVWKFTAQTTQSNLNAGVVRRLPIYYSSDVAEQRKIAQILNAIDQTIEKTEALIEKYQQIKAGLMHDLFTRGIGSDGKLRPPREQAPELYQETPIGWIPREWQLLQLGQNAKICSGVTLGAKSMPDQKISVPYLRVANVQDGYLDLREVKEILVSHNLFNSLRLMPGDVLMNEGGDFDKLGRGTVWRGEIDPCIHQNHVFRVRVDSEIFRPLFLAYWSQSEFGKKYFVLSSKQSTNLESINSTQLHKFQVACPTMSEQTAIEGRVDAANKCIESLSAELSKRIRQKSGLMHDLLTGKVPVNPDPPEPAHV